ncbi:magnesium/cobalt transporter CorA [Dongia sp.]|uniref:magnesium/cobalt transporter CorA n=1 Tax=Dongia sp. TaxID=1977262 RepID=UPI0035B30DAE
MGRVVDCAIYEGGRRLGSLDINDPEQMKVQPGRVIWIGLYEPGQDVLTKLQHYFGLHELAVEDAYRAHQRPKLELYAETMFVVMKTAQMDESHVAMGETSFFIGRGYIITVRHGPSTSYSDVRARCENSPENFKKGEDFILYALMDFIVDRYFPIVDSIEDDIERLEEAVLDGRSTMDVLEEITVLRRDLLHMRHAVAPLPEICQRLMRYDMALIDRNTHPYFRDVSDHSTILLDRIENLRELIKTVVDTKMLMSAMKQNEVMRQLAAWAAMLAVPTAVAGIYGMNFQNMPELTWKYGYFGVIGLIVAVCALLFVRFKRSGWL